MTCSMLVPEAAPSKLPLLTTKSPFRMAPAPAVRPPVDTVTPPLVTEMVPAVTTFPERGTCGSASSVTQTVSRAVAQPQLPHPRPLPTCSRTVEVVCRSMAFPLPPAAPVFLPLNTVPVNDGDDAYALRIAADVLDGMIDSVPAGTSTSPTTLAEPSTLRTPAATVTPPVTTDRPPAVVSVPLSVADSTSLEPVYRDKPLLLLAWGRREMRFPVYEELESDISSAEAEAVPEVMLNVPVDSKMLPATSLRGPAASTVPPLTARGPEVTDSPPVTVREPGTWSLFTVVKPLVNTCGVRGKVR